MRAELSKQTSEEIPARLREPVFSHQKGPAKLCRQSWAKDHKAELSCPKEQRNSLVIQEAKPMWSTEIIQAQFPHPWHVDPRASMGFVSRSYPCTKQATLEKSLTTGMKESKKLASLSVHGDKMWYPRRQTGLQGSTGWCWKLAGTRCQAGCTQGLK